MKKILMIFCIVVISLTSTGCTALGNDLKESIDIVIEKLTLKKPESNTEEMVSYLIDKAKKDSKFNDENTFRFSSNYIKDNIGDINGDNNIMENLIYYGAILQYSPKDKDDSSYTVVGMKTIEFVKNIYVRGDKDLDKTKVQIIKSLIDRVDM